MRAGRPRSPMWCMCSPDLAAGGLSVVAVPHMPYRRRVAERVPASAAIASSAFVKVRVAEHASFDTVGEDKDGDHEVITATLLPAMPKF